MNRVYILAALLMLGSLSLHAAAALPPGKVSQTVFLAAVPDPDLVGKKVDVVSRILTNNPAVSTKKIILRNVLLLSIDDSDSGSSGRNVNLALSPDELKKLNKISDRVGIDILVQSR